MTVAACGLQSQTKASSGESDHQFELLLLLKKLGFLCYRLWISPRFLVFDPIVKPSRVSDLS